MEVYKILLLLLAIGLLIIGCYIHRRVTRVSHPIYDIYNGPEWDSYRLGDVIKGWLTDNDPDYLTSVHERWPNSIGDKYMKHVGYPETFEKNDMPTLRDIFSTISDEGPDRETAVIHVRLGDIVKHAWKNTYVRDMAYYKRMLKSMREHPEIRKVRIIAGAHLNENRKASSELLHDIMGVFKGYDTQLVLTHNPDKDFYYMCHSKYFVKSGGGFSNLIEKYVRENGGTVFSEDDAGADIFVPI